MVVLVEKETLRKSVIAIERAYGLAEIIYLGPVLMTVNKHDLNGSYSIMHVVLGRVSTATPMEVKVDNTDDLYDTRAMS